MRAAVLCLVLVGCGVSGFRVTKSDGAPVLAPTSAAELVDAAPAGAQELGKIDVIGSDGDACKAEARDRARSLGATHVVVAPHPDPFAWQNTEGRTLEAPRCQGTAYFVAPGSAPPANAAPTPDLSAPPPAAPPAPASPPPPAAPPG